MKRIVLVGFRGTGKTVIGRELAQRLSLQFIDTDALVEKTTGRSISSIFHDEGEERFRDIEREVIAGLPASDAIVSTGGGAIMDPRNVENLRRDSIVFRLTADIETIEARLKRSHRPPLTTLPLAEEIASVLEKRRQYYQAAEDCCMDTRETTPDVAAGRILSVMKDGLPTAQQRNTALVFFRTGRSGPFAMHQLEEILTLKTGDPLTRVIGVAGYPCAHSRSPFLFNALFERYRLNYYYTWFEDPKLNEIMEVARAINAKGLSVTIPFKQDVMQFVDEIEEHYAQQIGAVNTVVFAGKTAIGYNTDWIGVRKPLVPYKGVRAVLLGAGGAATGAAFALKDLDMDVTILNRTPENAKVLAKRSGCRWGPLKDFDSIKPDVVVNATPLGMQPDTGSPLRDDQITKDMVVFDLVYTPPVTPLIEAARKKGCTTITGIEMFIEQAREQFYLFFGINVPPGTIREILA